VLGERDAVLVEAREDEPAIAVDARGAREPVGGLVEGLVAAGVGHPEQGALQVVGPAVVRAGQRARVAAIGRAHQGAAVPAAVDEDRDALAAPHHDDRLGTDAAGDIVARARDLALVADEDPPAVEDPLHLLREDPRIGVEGSVDAVVLHQGLVVDHRSESPETVVRCMSRWWRVVS
jgi:hypothetical protein